MDFQFNPNINHITNKELCRIYIDEFLKSTERKWMLSGEAYYKVDNTEIMERKMYRYQEDKITGNVQKIEDNAKPNNKRAHGFMHILVEDKVNYLLAKPYTLSCEKAEEYLDKVKHILGKTFQEKRLMRLGVFASNSGIGWLHPYINENGEFKTSIIEPWQGIPLWNDKDHEDLVGFIWFYDVDVIEGKELKTVTKVEYWTLEGVAYYISETSGDGMNLILDADRYLNSEMGEGEFMEHFFVKNTPGTWERVPFIAFKNNDYELPDLKFVKTLIDGYDKSRSDVANLLDEIKSVIYALKGYGGNDLGQFMRDLNYFRAIALDEDGSAEALSSNIDISAAKDDFETLKKDIYNFGQGVDRNSDRFGNSPSGIALKFIYSGLDLKCNRMENAFKDGLNQLMWFVNKYLEMTNQGSNYDTEIDFTFNRDIAINESQAILDCKNSKGLISDETIIKNHPWVESVDEEKQLLQENEMAAAAELSAMFPITNENPDKKDKGDE